MAEAVVEILEVVDVDEQQRQRLPDRGGMLDRTPTVRLERMAVERSGECVAAGAR